MDAEAHSIRHSMSQSLSPSPMRQIQKFHLPFDDQSNLLLEQFVQRNTVVLVQPVPFARILI